MAKLTLRGCKVIFANLTDEGFGTSLTIEVTPDNEPQIKEFWAAEKIGNEKTEIGVPLIKDFEGTKQLSLKINNVTKIAKINPSDELGWGATVDVVVNSFEYNNKFTKGKTYVGASLSAVVVTKGRQTGADSDLAELLASYENSSGDFDTPTSEKGGGEQDLPF